MEGNARERSESGTSQRSSLYDRYVLREPTPSYDRNMITGLYP